LSRSKLEWLSECLLIISGTNLYILHQYSQASIVIQISFFVRRWTQFFVDRKS
jgi:hypothetical protein